DLAAEELDQKLAELKEELFNLRFQAATRQLDNPMRMNAVKKDIARVKTVMRERELQLNRSEERSKRQWWKRLKRTAETDGRPGKASSTPIGWIRRAGAR